MRIRRRINRNGQPIADMKAVKISSNEITRIIDKINASIRL